MRLDPKQRKFLKESILRILPDATVYLFGSRTDDQRKGGDIDVLVIASRRLKFSENVDIHYEFERAFGEQKLDVVSYAEMDQDPFKQVALKGALPL